MQMIFREIIYRNWSTADSRQKESIFIFLTAFFPLEKRKNTKNPPHPARESGKNGDSGTMILKSAGPLHSEPHTINY